MSLFALYMFRSCFCALTFYFFCVVWCMHSCLEPLVRDTYKHGMKIITHSTVHYSPPYVPLMHSHEVISLLQYTSQPSLWISYAYSWSYIIFGIVSEDFEISIRMTAQLKYMNMDCNNWQMLNIYESHAVHVVCMYRGLTSSYLCQTVAWFWHVRFILNKQ